MAKVANLQALLSYLEIRRQVYAHLVLLHPTHEPETRPARLGQLAEYALIATELEDHLYNLTSMVAACQHGLARTAPDGDDPAAYDPYAVLHAHLAEQWRMPVLELSPLLLAYIDELPEQERLGAAAVLQHHPTALWAPDETGSLRPVPAEQAPYEPERSFLRQVEKNFFTLTYADELAHVVELVAARGSLRRILDLVA